MFHVLKFHLHFVLNNRLCLYRTGFWLLFYGCLVGTVLRQQLERSGASFAKVHAGNNASRGMKSQLNGVSIMLLAGFHFSMLLFFQEACISNVGSEPDTWVESSR